MTRSPATDPVQAGHWLLHKQEPPRRRIDAQAIVEQAHVLVHEGGSVALSMRALAAALGTSPTALYRHFPAKQWLLVAIVDHVLAEVETSPTDADDMPGRERLERLSSSVRAVLSAHPHLHEILTSQVALTPSTMRMAEAALGCLRDWGIADADLLDTYNAWCGYVIGFTAIEVKPPELAPDAQLKQAMRAQLEQTTAHDFPIVSELLPQVANLAYGLSWRPARLGATGTSFAWGLKALLDGIEASKRTRRTK
jgi:TetR/AcrR family transcriptional regulator, tetracycline repressor protein